MGLPRPLYNPYQPGELGEFGIQYCAWSSDSSLVAASCDLLRTVSVWRVPDGALMWRFTDNEAPVLPLRFWGARTLVFAETRHAAVHVVDFGPALLRDPHAAAKRVELDAFLNRRRTDPPGRPEEILLVAPCAGHGAAAAGAVAAATRAGAAAAGAGAAASAGATSAGGAGAGDGKGEGGGEGGGAGSSGGGGGGSGDGAGSSGGGDGGSGGTTKEPALREAWCLEEVAVINHPSTRDIEDGRSFRAHGLEVTPLGRVLVARHEDLWEFRLTAAIPPSGPGLLLRPPAFRAAVRLLLLAARAGGPDCQLARLPAEAVERILSGSADDLGVWAREDDGRQLPTMYGHGCGPWLELPWGSVHDVPAPPAAAAAAAAAAAGGPGGGGDEGKGARQRSG